MRRNTLLPVVLALAIVACSGSGPSPTDPVETTAAPNATAFPVPTASDTPEPTAIPVDRQTYELLKAVEPPFADPVDLAIRLGGFTGELAGTPEPPSQPLAVGTRNQFWITDSNDQNVQVQATLQYVTEHAYFWVQDDVIYDQVDLETLAETFEGRIYPTTRSFFGSEPNPGIDGDPHIYVLYARRLGINVAGYFSSVDSLPPAIRADSNGHEMFVFNADNVELADQFTYGVLAHEFQHMIHWNIDRDETTWIGEGLAELAVHLNRLGTAGFHTEYTDDPVVSLNDWPNGDDTVPHYGAASLYTLYFMNRFGSDLTKAMAAHQDDGLQGIDSTLSEAGVVDPIREALLTADDTALDWAIANYLNDLEIADGRFGYPSFSDFRPARQTQTLVECESDAEPRQVNQFAPHYIRMICPGRRTLRFEGAVETTLLPADAYSGEYAFWSNKGALSDMRLTRQFDLTAVSGPIEFVYQTWYDIERDWDYAYLLASIDGQRWDMLQVPGGTDTNPTGGNYGWGYTGTTRRSEWIEQRVDLSDYAGGSVWLRFEYVTDLSVHGEGMLIDDLAIPAIGYFSDLESDDGGWEAEGWVRVRNVLPQSFLLAWITFGDQTRVEYVSAGVNNILELPMDLPEEGGARVLVVFPTTRFTRQPASYSLSFSN